MGTLWVSLNATITTLAFFSSYSSVDDCRGDCSSSSTSFSTTWNNWGDNVSAFSTPFTPFQLLLGVVWEFGKENREQDESHRKDSGSKSLIKCVWFPVGEHIPDVCPLVSYTLSVIPRVIWEGEKEQSRSRRRGLDGGGASGQIEGD